MAAWTSAADLIHRIGIVLIDEGVDRGVGGSKRGAAQGSQTPAEKYELVALEIGIHVIPGRGDSADCLHHGL